MFPPPLICVFDVNYELTSTAGLGKIGGPLIGLLMELFMKEKQTNKARKKNKKTRKQKEKNQRRKKNQIDRERARERER